MHSGKENTKYSSILIAICKIMHGLFWINISFLMTLRYNLAYFKIKIASHISHAIESMLKHGMATSQNDQPHLTRNH